MLTVIYERIRSQIRKIMKSLDELKRIVSEDPFKDAGVKGLGTRASKGYDTERSRYTRSLRQAMVPTEPRLSHLPDEYS